jgi:cell division protein FtsN
VNSTYFIKVGPYQGGIPVEQAREILMLNSLGVVVEKNNNATLYKIGNFTDRQEAEAIKVDLVSKGFSNPTVVKNE